MKLHIGNLSYSVTESDLNEIFKSFKAKPARIILDRNTNKSNGFAFVEISDETLGRQAIGQLNGKELRGRKIKISEARPSGGGGGTEPGCPEKRRETSTP